MIFFRIIVIFLFFCFTANADQKDTRLNKLFNLLAESKSDAEIDIITSDIWNIWMETNDPLIKADFYRGLETMRNGNLNMSIVFFTRVIKINPNFAEAWNKRATVYYMIGDFDSSMIDINATLKLEPRHFGALDGLGLILIHLQEFEKAIRVYDQMLTIFPNNSSIVQKREYLIKLLSESA